MAEEMEGEPAWSTSTRPDASDVSEKSPAFCAAHDPHALRHSASGLPSANILAEMAHVWAAHPSRIITF
jgi:hypothetical protein